jgi:hypothetical protein
MQVLSEQLLEPLGVLVDQPWHMFWWALPVKEMLGEVSTGHQYVTERQAAPDLMGYEKHLAAARLEGFHLQIHQPVDNMDSWMGGQNEEAQKVPRVVVGLLAMTLLVLLVYSFCHLELGWVRRAEYG